MADDKLQQLKAKYQSVLNQMEKLGVQLQNLHVKDNKLVIRGRAKSQADSNKVWDQIKLVDPSYQQDLMAEISYEATPPPQASASKTHTVQPGDTLSKISKKFYGDPNQYPRIVEANKDKISDPDKIFPGQVLTIP